MPYNDALPYPNQDQELIATKTCQNYRTGSDFLSRILYHLPIHRELKPLWREEFFGKIRRPRGLKETSEKL